MKTTIVLLHFDESDLAVFREAHLMFSDEPRLACQKVSQSKVCRKSQAKAQQLSVILGYLTNDIMGKGLAFCNQYKVWKGTEIVFKFKKKLTDIH